MKIQEKIFITIIIPCLLDHILHFKNTEQHKKHKIKIKKYKQILLKINKQIN
jgi:uncharacterized membrane protein